MTQFAKVVEDLECQNKASTNFPKIEKFSRELLKYTERSKISEKISEKMTDLYHRDTFKIRFH